MQGTLTLMTFWVADRALQWGAGLLDLAGPADPAGLPLFGLVLLAVGGGALPMANAWSRHVERGADRFALETIADPVRMMTMAIAIRHVSGSCSSHVPRTTATTGLTYG